MAALAETINRDLETAILEVLTAARKALTLDELVHELDKRPIRDDARLKGTIWWLISEHKIELTADRKLILCK